MPIPYRNPPKTKGSRGRALPSSQRPSQAYSEEEIDVMRRQLEVRFAEFTAGLEAQGMLGEMLALAERSAKTVQGRDAQDAGRRRHGR